MLRSLKLGFLPQRFTISIQKNDSVSFCSPGRRKRKRPEEQPDQDSGLGSSCSMSLTSGRARCLELDQFEGSARTGTADAKRHFRNSCSEGTTRGGAPGSPSTNMSDPQEFADARSEPAQSSGR